LKEARKVAENEGVALNQLINIAVAEKISALRTEDFFLERSRNANIQEALRSLRNAGTEAPREGDEMPPDEPAQEVDPALDRILRKAIRTKRLLGFSYRDQQRIVEPHDYGIQNGNVRLFCFQVGGQSGGKLSGWRMLDVSEIRDCKIMEGEFAGNRDVSSGKHHYWDEIFMRVTPPSKRLPSSNESDVKRGRVTVRH
jgi:predicted DNA-binding transcriptional regulator YafY